MTDKTSGGTAADKVISLAREPGRFDPGLRVYRDTAHVISAVAPDHPLYCLCQGQLRTQAKRFQQGFPGATAYAVKANAHPAVVAALADAGMEHFDVASMSEVALVRNLAPGATLLYDNPVKSRDEIGRAYRDFNVRSFALDDSIELRKIADIAGRDRSVQMNVRFKLPKVMPAQDLSSKFGATLEDAVRLLREVVNLGYRPALTFHPGSQCTDPLAYDEYIAGAAALAAAAGVQLSMLNVGGGFPAPYRNAQVPLLVEYFRAVGKAFRREFPGTGTLLVCEPGRSMVAASASLLTRVKHRRAGRTVYLNDGIYGGLLEHLMFRISTPVRVFRAGKLLRGANAEFVVFGPTCDSTDRLPLTVPLPEDVAEGDWVEFGMMGAYGSATATRFNGFESDQYVEVVRGFPASGLR
ncbi:MAG: type III PLP-dependent enzyme [Gammaproteobacteria bacterium]|nr:type III PLP-dependent enzyme [Gammaproteobacteria bacterium]